MRYVYTADEVRIYPDDDDHLRCVTVTKPKVVNGRRTRPMISWPKNPAAYPDRGYLFAQAIFVAAGLADIFNLTTDLNAIRKFGVPQ